MNPTESAPDRWHSIEELYHAALDLPNDQRAAYLRAACADERIRREVESLLGFDIRSGGLLNHPLGKHLAALLPGDETRTLVMKARLAPGTHISHYTIRDFLGAGGMGQVFAAQDDQLNRLVALKLLLEATRNDPDRIRRFVLEARAASALNHPNIVTIHELGECEHGRFIVMELVHGRSLHQRMREGLTMPDVLSFAGQMAKAVAAAHAAGIVHRDLKPANVMVREDGCVKVLDFGLARMTAAVAAAEEDTAAGAVMGTLKYMSPEQGRGGTVGPASDVFSLGLVLYEMATGHYPFKAPNAYAAFEALATQAATPPAILNPEVPPFLEELILAMLEKTSERRPSAEQVAEALEDFRLGGHPGKPTSTARAVSREMVGRDAERELLISALAARSGQLNLVCVTAESGLGKSTFVEETLHDLESRGEPLLVGHGRCSAHAAGGEAYLPVLEALDSLLRSGTASWIARTMRFLAPGWYAQIAPAHETTGTMPAGNPLSRERMKRELVALLQTLSKDRRLVLFFDDLHWADDATVNLMSFLASQYDQLNVSLVVAYRESEALLAKHSFLSLKLDMQSRHLCHEVSLGSLNRLAIERLIALQFPENRFPAGLAATIHSRTEGHPLFVADLLRYLRDRKAVVQENGIWLLSAPVQEIEKLLPESVRSMVQRKMEQLSEEDRKLLVTASVQGFDFDTAVVANVLEMDPLEIEERLERLERTHRFVRMTEERDMPDGTLSCRYQFVHNFYQDSFYSTLRPTRRAALSGAMARALVTFHGKKKSEIAGDLARLSATAREFGEAAEYCLIAAENAAVLFAHKEAATMARRGLENLKQTPAGPERAARELSLQLALGRSLALTSGYVDPQVGACFMRATELASDIGHEVAYFPAVYGAWMVNFPAVNLTKAMELGQHLIRMAEGSNDEILMAAAWSSVSLVLELMGDIRGALGYAERILALKPVKSSIFVARFLLDPALNAHWTRFRALWMTGFADQARAEAERTLDHIGRERIDPRTTCATLISAAYFYQFCADTAKVRSLVDRAKQVATQHDMPLELQWARLLEGWLVARQESHENGIAQMREVLNFLRGAGVLMFMGTSFAAVLAEELIAAKKLDEAWEETSQGLEFANRTGHRYCESELHRVQGEVLAMRGQAEAEASFRQAIETARASGVRALELRAMVSLASWLRAQGRGEEGCRMLAPVHSSFTEGFDMPDWVEARRILDLSNGVEQAAGA